MSGWTIVTSTSIAALAYDESSATLYVRFVDGGRTYSYRDVPAEVFERFMAAPSKGRFLEEAVKGRFPYARIA